MLPSLLPKFKYVDSIFPTLRMWESTTNWDDIPGTGMLRANVREDDEAYCLDINAAGMDKENFTIKVEDGMLIINHTLPTEWKPTYVSQEFKYESATRKFSIDSDLVDISKISAKMVNGILSIVVPKTEKAKPRSVNVKIE